MSYFARSANVSGCNGLAASSATTWSVTGSLCSECAVRAQTVRMGGRGRGVILRRSDALITGLANAMTPNHRGRIVVLYVVSSMRSVCVVV